VRHQDPSFIKKRLQESPEAAGMNLMSFLCCNYWMVKTLAEPFLNTSHTIQTLIYSLSDCVNTVRSKTNCACLELNDSVDLDYMESNSKQEDERKERNILFSSTSLSSLSLVKIAYYATIFIAYTIILIFIYASFTV
jgi:hypothetical protein